MQQFREIEDLAWDAGRPPIALAISRYKGQASRTIGWAINGPMAERRIVLPPIEVEGMPVMSATSYVGNLKPFDPAVADNLGRAFDAAWERLEAARSAYAQPPQAEKTRERLALRIVDLAKAGEYDPIRLRDAALAELRVEP